MSLCIKSDLGLKWVMVPLMIAVNPKGIKLFTASSVCRIGFIKQVVDAQLFTEIYKGGDKTIGVFKSLAL